MATLKDISRHLNLSVTTISRALNGFPEVNEETRLLVVKTAAAMNYRPNQFAQKLVTGRSGMVCMIIQASPDLSANIHFMEVVTGLSQYFSAHGMHFILHVSTEFDVLAPYRSMTAGNLMDGYILTHPTPNDPRVEFLRGKNVPFVMHGRLDEDSDYPYYDIENYGVSRQATEYLLSIGHQRITLLNGPAELSFAKQRKAGFLDAMSASDMSDADIIDDMSGVQVHHGQMTEEFGHRTAKAVLSRSGAIRPSAIICSNILIAEGVYEAAKEMGLKIPEDLSVIAHDDDIPLHRANEMKPPLSVTHSALRDALEPLANILMRRIKSEESIKSLQEVAPTKLIIRESTRLLF